MQKINELYTKTNNIFPEKVLQIGEGNFLRAFADYAIDIADRQGVFDGSVILCQPRGSGHIDVFNSQNCMYTVLLRGIENGKKVEKAELVSCISRCVSPYYDYYGFLELAKNDELSVIISNTTEAGIVYREGDKPTDNPPESYPAKLTAFLYARFKAMYGNTEKGFLILPTELIDSNGKALKEIVYRYADEWELGRGFTDWLNASCCFADTLVDRIVTGYPKDEIVSLQDTLGFEDKLLDCCEPFMFWAIECDEKFRDRFPLDKIGLNIVYTDDLSLYRTRKVRILNGSHTASVLSAFLSGYDTVKEMMDDEKYALFIKKALNEEIMPTISLPENELQQYADAVLERFSNPYIKHRLLDISLNSVSKFRARNLGVIVDYYQKNGYAPTCLCYSLASLIRFYKGEIIDGKYVGTRGTQQYEIRDNADVIKFFAAAYQTDDAVAEILKNPSLWGIDLTKIYGLYDKVSKYYGMIEEFGSSYTINEIVV